MINGVGNSSEEADHRIRCGSRNDVDGHILADAASFVGDGQGVFRSAGGVHQNLARSGEIADTNNGNGVAVLGYPIERCGLSFVNGGGNSVEDVDDGRGNGCRCVCRNG